jgi:nicotinamide-nucleotide amidase
MQLSEKYAVQVVELLTKRKETLALAESCTGGYIAHLITSVPGASQVFLGSVVSYANDAKMKLLGVSENTLKHVGAVSEESALAMAAGAKALFGSDWALSTTGIAGPGGGTKRKPVGTLFFSIRGPKESQVSHLHVEDLDRKKNVHAFAQTALKNLYDAILTP